MDNPALEFQGHLRYLGYSRTKLEELYRKGRVVRRDVEQVYAGLFLDASASFEQFIEDLFLGLLTGKISVSSKASPNVTFKTRQLAHKVVSSGRPYIDWLPFATLEDKANIFFKGGNPFTALDDDERRKINELVHIRNAIAHKSNHAKQVFESKVLRTLPLLPRERTPAGYLRSTFSIAPPQTRYEEKMLDMAAIAGKLCR